MASLVSSTSMAVSSTFLMTDRWAVVTGANKGIGFEVCKQLASKGVNVILTSRDESRGLEALRKLKDEISPAVEVAFHQLDVANPSSIVSFVDFMTARFEKLDILVNNAGVVGAVSDFDAYAKACEQAGRMLTDPREIKAFAVQTYELAQACLETNYNGARRLTDALLPLLDKSSSPRIVNVSSEAGILKDVTVKSVRDTLDDIENLTRDGIDDILEGFLRDFREGQLGTRGWPEDFSAYRISKATLNAYTRVLAKELPCFLVNCVCPGSVRTDMTGYNGEDSASTGAERIVRLALLPETGPSGCFFIRKELQPF